MEKRKIMFLINPRAGKGRGFEHKRKIEEIFRKSEDEVTIAVTSEKGSNSIFSLTKRAVEECFDVLVSVGGDGTHNLVVNSMVAAAKEQNLSSPESLPSLGLIGTGTGNNLNKNLGLQSGFKEAINVIKSGHTRFIDFGLLSSGEEKRYFINVVSFGFDGLVVSELKKAKEKKRYRLVPKSLSYLLIALRRIIIEIPSYRVRLSGPDLALETETSLMAVLNGPTYGTIFHMAPGADLSDGSFNVYLINKVGRLKALTILPRVILGKHDGLPQVKSFKVSSLAIFSSQALPCEIDGEVMPSSREYEIYVLPKALKVLVPQS